MTKRKKISSLISRTIGRITWEIPHNNPSLEFRDEAGGLMFIVNPDDIFNHDGNRFEIDIEPEDGSVLTALRSAESFISGFEGDELQEGVREKLTMIRAAIIKAEGRS